MTCPAPSCPTEPPRPAGGGRLRVVVPALWYHPERPSGSSRLAYDEARHLAQLGHDVWLVAMDGGTGQPEQVLDNGLHVLRYRRPPWAAFDVTGGHERTVRRLLARHVGRDVDLVHAHMLLPGAAAFDLYGSRARTCYSLHSPVRAELQASARGASAPERARLRLAAVVRSRLERRLLSHCNATTCDSAFTRRLVAEIHGPGVADRMQVVPGWVDLTRFRILDDRLAAKQALGWPTDRPVLFCLRRFVPRMGLDVLLAAAARLHASRRPFHLVIAGDGPLRPRTMEQAAALGLDALVSFPGRIADERLPMMFGAADAFVLPTVELECFGLPVLEALACGSPVLATPVGAIPEVLGEVEPRWLARAATPSGMGDLLEDFLAGRLPEWPTARLRGFVAGRYSMHERVARLAQVAIGEPGVA